MCSLGTLNDKHIYVYCRYVNIRKVLFFAKFVKRTNSRNQESRENYFYNSDTKKMKIGENLPKIYTKITRSTVFKSTKVFKCANTCASTQIFSQVRK